MRPVSGAILGRPGPVGPISAMEQRMNPFGSIQARLTLRLTRRWLQLRAKLKARQLKVSVDRTNAMPSGPLLFSTIRNEADRLPYFLDYYRKLGIAHFLIIDNGSTDDGPRWLAEQDDVSVWTTTASYKASRFGVDWLNALITRHGMGRWVLVVDPDEFLVYPFCDTRPLPALTRWLEAEGRHSFGTFLLDLYGDKPIRATHVGRGQDPVAAAPWFDASNYVVERRVPHRNLWVQGGPRMRSFFADKPNKAPALNKIPLVFWRPGTVFNTGAHDLLPRGLNQVYARRGGSMTSGALLHAKFIDALPAKVAEEMTRREHYADSAEYASYSRAGDDICLWTPQSTRYRDWRQLLDMGLITRGAWF